jgi:hypothetical protein
MGNGNTHRCAGETGKEYGVKVFDDTRSSGFDFVESFACAPGMGVDLEVRVLCGAWSWQPLAKGKGVHREVKSEGSRRQIRALRHTNRIRRLQLDELARQREVRYDQGLQA